MLTPFPKDHVLVGQAYAVNLTTHSQISASPAFAAQSVAEYNQNRTGILTNPGADFLGKFHLLACLLVSESNFDLTLSIPSV